MTGIDKIGKIYEENINPKEKDTQQGKKEIDDAGEPLPIRPYGV